MINKIRRSLIKEIRQIQRKLTHNNYVFGIENEYFNAHSYHVYLTNGRSFQIVCGTNFIPKFKYTEVLYILKEFYNADKYNYIDTNIGLFSGDHYKLCDVLKDNWNRYKCDPYKDIKTGTEGEDY